MKTSSLILLAVLVAALAYLVWMHDRQLKELADDLYKPGALGGDLDGLPHLTMEEETINP